MRWWRFSLIAVLALAAGCGSDNDDPVVDEAPLVILSTVPADAQPTPYVGLVSSEANFNRAAAASELRSWFLPPVPGATFVPKSSSGLGWTWKDLRLEAASEYYFWVIDGVRLGRWTTLNDERVFVRLPVVVRVPSSFARQAAVGFAGKVTSSSPNVLASGTLLFALPPDSGFNQLDPANTFHPEDALGVARANRNDDYVDQPANYRASYLPLDELFVVVAVKDTNEDLYYSPADDWWGMYLVEGELGPVFARLDTGDKDSLFNEAVDVILRAPVAPTD